MLTCSGDLSRNRQVGLRLGAGESLEDIASSMCMVAEGVKTTQAVHRLAQRLGVDMPVTGTMYSVLSEGFAPREAVQALMGRQLKEEELEGVERGRFVFTVERRKSFGGSSAIF